MKVAIITGRDPGFKNDTDGGSVFIKKFALSLANKKGVHIQVFTPAGMAGGVYKKEKQKSIQTADFDNLSQNIDVIRFNVSYDDMKLDTLSDEEYFFNRIKLSDKIASFFADKKLFDFDLVLILHSANAFGLIEAGLVPVNKTVLFPMMTTPTYKLFSKVPEQYVQKEKSLFENIKHVSDPSADEIKIITSFYKVDDKKFFKVNRGFDDNVFQARLRESVKTKGSVTLFSANGIRPQKNHLFFIPVVQELIRRGIDVKFVLTGNNGLSHNDVYNDYAQKFWQEVSNQGLEKVFTARGVVTESELNQAMLDSDIALYPSTAETFGKSALESMATGLPTLVGNNIQAYEEFIKNGETGFSLDLDPVIFADSIEELMNNNDLFQAISSNGIKLGQDFAWRKIADNFMSKLKTLNIV